MNPTRSSKKNAGNSRLSASPKRETERSAKAPDGGTADPQGPVMPDELHRMIAVAAYCRAERRHFIGGNEVEDWLAAEAEIKEAIGDAWPRT